MLRVRIANARMPTTIGSALNSRNMPLFQALRKFTAGPLQKKPAPRTSFTPPSGPRSDSGSSGPPTAPDPLPTEVPVSPLDPNAVTPPPGPSPDPGIGTTPSETPIDAGTPPGGGGPPIFGEQDQNLNPYSMPSMVNPFLAPFLTRMALQGLLGNLGQRAKRRLPNPSLNPYSG